MITLTGDKVRVKVLEILTNGSIGGVYQLGATGQIAGLTATYKMPERVIIEDAKTGAGLPAISGVQEGVIVDKDIQMNKRLTARYELETLDFATQELADAEAGVIASSLMATFDAHMDAEFISQLITADATPLVPTFTSTLAIDKIMADDELAKMFHIISDEVSKFEGIIDKNTLGIERTSINQMVSPFIYSRYIAYLKQYTGAGVDMTMRGRLQGQVMAGVNVIRHPMLGNSYTAGLIHKTKAFDFSKTHCIIFHSEAVAIPFNALPNISVMPNKDTLNYQVGMKTSYGIGTLRPLVRVINNA